MNCIFHPTNAASARCGACERPLCPACDHRIKGSPYCQDCIVAGIETLRRNAGAGRHAFNQTGRMEEKSPLIALLLGLVPGVGAAYNGQNIKALAHFLAVAGLWVLADIFGWPLEIALGLGGAGFYFYSVYDAFQSAQRLRRGEDLRVEDERLKLFLQRRMNLFGALLIGVGALAMLDFWIPKGGLSNAAPVCGRVESRPRRARFGGHPVPRAVARGADSSYTAFKRMKTISHRGHREHRGNIMISLCPL